jgi:hypothetical protein
MESMERRFDQMEKRFEQMNSLNTVNEELVRLKSTRSSENYVTECLAAIDKRVSLLENQI